MAKKDQEKVNFLEPEETNESKTRLVKNGHTYKVVLTWRGKTYMVQMFVPSVSRPTRQEIEKEVQKLYPDAKVMSFLPRDLEPGEPTVMMGEEKRDEYGDIVGGPKISKKQKAKNLAKNEKDEQHTTTTSEGLLGMLRGAQIGGKLQALNPGMATPLPISKTSLIGAGLGSDVEDKLKKKKKKCVEVEEYLFELKPSTLGSYIKKASTSRAALAVSGTLRKKPGTNVPDINARKSDTLKSLKRGKMIDLATNKLVKKASKGGTIRGASPDSTQYFSQEEYVAEDDMKGMSVKSGHKRPTKSGAGMTQKGVEAYRRRNPGSKLKTAVTGKVKKGSKDAKRRKSYCASSAGQMKKFPKAAKDPNSRLRQARRRWKC